MSGLEAIAVIVLVVALCVIGLAVRSRLLRFDGDLYVVTTPPATRGDPEHFFRGLHGLLRSPLRRLIFGQPWIALELEAIDGQVQLQVWIPRGEKPLVESLLRAAYPGATLTLAHRPDTVGARHAGGQAHLARGNDLPIRTAFDGGEPLSSLLWTTARVPFGSTLTTQLLVRPRPNDWQRKAEGRAQALRDRQRLDKNLFRPTRVLPASGRPRSGESDRRKGERSRVRLRAAGDRLSPARARRARARPLGRGRTAGVRR